MPYGCGTWPALWMVGSNWPNNGEIDIIEGVHVNTNNLTSLHTRAGCRLSPEAKVDGGRVEHHNCDGKADGNAGCGFKWNSNRSWGKPFNDSNGGVIVMNWTKTEMTFRYVHRADVHKFKVLVKPPAKLPKKFNLKQKPSYNAI